MEHQRHAARAGVTRRSPRLAIERDLLPELRSVLTEQMGQQPRTDLSRQPERLWIARCGQPNR